ncbi:MAG TPA: LUD domain-containing protein [Bacteroidia bacterium]|nr:LUD domain-containing protein [Bacteroidia bacterium]
MSDSKTTFLTVVEHSIKDKALRQKISAASANHRNAFEEGKKQYAQLETARQRAAFAKWKAIENLDKYLIEFEAAFIKSGGKIIWAQDANEATDEILKIVNRFRDGLVVKSKSMITEEIGLNAVLQKNSHQVMETDLGQYIIQITNDTPSHMILPVLHKSGEEIIELYQASNSKVETVEDVVKTTRNILREKYRDASVGISGANFVIADSGAVSISENEGNAVLCTAMPRVHIVVAGIDKVIPSLNDLDLFLPLLSTFGTGQPLTVYNTIITGPCHNEEPSGPSEMYIVLVDNGRTKVMADEIQRQSMHCIHCGACMFNDPVYRIIGGHAYSNIYNGPFGSAILPHKEEMKEYVHLGEANPLDGSATDSCPVNINFNKLFLQNRKSAVDQQLTAKSEKWFYFFWKKAVLKRNLIKLTGIKTLGYFVNSIFNKSENGLRETRDPVKKSFNEQWREKMKS